MNKLKLSLVISLLVIGSASVQAAKDEERDNNKNPSGCRDVGYHYELKTLNLVPDESQGRQSMYFLFNKLNQPVSLYQMRDDESSRTLYLNHTIVAQQWAVLSMSEKKIKYICTVPAQHSQYGAVVDCADAVKVCEYTNVRYGLNNRGNFWIVNSNTRNGAVRDVVRYGIVPAL